MISWVTLDIPISSVATEENNAGRISRRTKPKQAVQQLRQILFEYCYLNEAQVFALEM